MANNGLPNTSNKMWNATNISSSPISISDIPTLPTLQVGQTLDALRYASQDVISTSVNLPEAINAGKIAFAQIQVDTATTDSGNGGGGGGAPSGPAGGVLSGTYPNPTIAAGAITGPMLAAGAVSAANISNGSITGAKIASGTITNINIANGAIDSSKILDGSILGTDISTGTINLLNLAPNSVDSSKIVDGSVTGTDIAASTITNNNIVNATITGAKIANDTITSGNILDGTITGTDIAPSTITGSNVVNGSIAGSQIANTPSGSISATTVQGAISELDSDITALAAANTGKADKTITITGVGALAGGGDLSANRTLDIAVVAGLTAATYGSVTQVAQVTVNTKGQVTAATNVTVTPAFSSLTGKPTTLSGYGITDGQTNSLVNGDILIGNASNIATPVAVSGDITITNTGVTSIGAGKVTNTMLVSGPTNTVKGSVNGVQQIDMNSAQLQTILGLGTLAYLNSGTSAGQVPVLMSDGTFPASTIPALFINHVYTGLAADRTTKTIANGGASDALVGDVYKQTDGSMNAYILQSTPGSAASNWVLISSSTTPWTSITGTPTTIAGYGITDAMALVPAAANGHFAIFNAVGQVVDGGSTTSMVVLNTLTSSTNTMTSTVNGVAANAPIVNSNVLSLGTNAVTNTVNGIASNALSLNAVTLAGDITGTIGATTLSLTGVTAGTYGSSAQIPVVTVDAKGRITTLTTAPAPTGTTNLSYTASPTNGVVNSDTGTDATVPLATGTNAGLFSPSDFTKLASYPSTPAQTTSNLAYVASPTNGVVTNDNGTGFTAPLADATNAGLLSPAGFSNMSSISQPNQQIVYGTGSGISSDSSLQYSVGLDGFTRTASVSTLDIYNIGAASNLIRSTANQFQFTVPESGNNGTFGVLNGGVSGVFSSNNISQRTDVTDGKNGIFIFDGTNVVAPTSKINGYIPLYADNSTDRLKVRTASANESIAYLSDLTAFKSWSSTQTYINGNIVLGSDGNLYRAIGTNTNEDPTTAVDTVNWFLFMALSNITVNVPARFTTIAKALTFVSRTAYCPLTITIQLADGTYPLATSGIGGSYNNVSNFVLSGNTTTPANVVINPTSNNEPIFSTTSRTTNLTIQGITFDAAGFTGCTAITTNAFAGPTVVSNCNFTNCATDILQRGNLLTLSGTINATSTASSNFINYQSGDITSSATLNATNKNLIVGQSVNTSVQLSGNITCTTTVAVPICISLRSGTIMTLGGSFSITGYTGTGIQLLTGSMITTNAGGTRTIDNCVIGIDADNASQISLVSNTMTIQNCSTAPYRVQHNSTSHIAGLTLTANGNSNAPIIDATSVSY